MGQQQGRETGISAYILGDAFHGIWHSFTLLGQSRNNGKIAQAVFEKHSRRK